MIKESELFGTGGNKKSKKVSKTGRRAKKKAPKGKSKGRKLSAIARARANKSKKLSSKKIAKLDKKSERKKQIGELHSISEEEQDSGEETDSEIDEFIEPDEKELELEKEEFDKKVSKSFPKRVQFKKGYNKPYKVLTIVDKFVDEIKRWFPEAFIRKVEPNLEFLQMRKKYLM